MSYEEKNTWLFGFIAIAAYAVYLAIVLPLLGAPVADVPYQVPMIWTIGGAVVSGIVGGILIGIFSGGRTSSDQRDKQISRFGEQVGNSFVVIAGVGALILAFVEADHFWIANALYLGFVLASVLSTIAKLVAYRRGLHSW